MIRRDGGEIDRESQRRSLKLELEASRQGPAVAVGLPVMV